ncbi:hypothetical protein Tco_1383652 [Tanacetum coccineum]
MCGIRQGRTNKPPRTPRELHPCRSSKDSAKSTMKKLQTDQIWQIEYEYKEKKKAGEVKARLDFGDARKKSTRAQESAYSESRTISPRRQRPSYANSPRPTILFPPQGLGVKGQDRHGMNTRARKEEKAPCSRDLEAEDRVHPRTPTAVRKAQGIQKITLKAKIMKVGTGSLNYEEKVPLSKMMISSQAWVCPRRILLRGLESSGPLRLPENANAKSCENIQRKRRS